VEVEVPAAAELGCEPGFGAATTIAAAPQRAAGVGAAGPVSVAPDLTVGC
jgi:hypothetical protein